jgi:hypothetical protein
VAKQVTIDWGDAALPESDRRTWLAAWLVDRDGVEGDFFYDGRGGEVTSHAIPDGAVGFRLRSWPPEKPTDSGNSVGARPMATKPFWFDGYDGSTLRAADLP